MKNGRFITLEGTEGVGKSTNLQYVTECLRKKNIDVVLTREPGGTPIAELIRELILAKHDEKMCDMSELLLVFAARAQHLNQVILPALQRGAWVLSDRFTDATYAYQGYGRGLSMDVIQQLENLVQNTIRPDLTILLDIDVETGLQRASERSEPDRIELEERQFFEAVRHGYLELAKKNPKRYVIIDASKELVEVQKSIHEKLVSFVDRSQQ
ncbi:dTMP kinase [Aurantivibrio infirmus]